MSVDKPSPAQEANTMQISEKQIKLAREKFREISGITIYTPDEGTLDDFEQARYDGLVAALEAALSTDAEPVAARYDFDGYGFQYIDSGSGSDWKTRKPDADLLYDRPQPPAPAVAVKALLERVSDLTAERDSLAAIVASGVDEIAGAALDDAEEAISRLASNRKAVTNDMIQAGARAVASRWGRTTVWEEDETVAQSVLVAALSAQVQDVATARDFADRMFKLHGFMLSEEYRGKPAVTITFPDNAERNQFYSAIVDLSTHKTPAAPAAKQGEAE